MNRRYLALGVAIVVVAAIGLYVASRRSDPGGTTAAHEGPGSPGDPKKPEADPGTPKIKVTQTPAGTNPRPELTGSGSAVSDYMVGGVRIRDHRSGDHAPIDVPPSIHPPQGRKIPSQLTSDIAQQLRSVTTACTASLPTAERGPQARLEGEIKIAIKDHQVQVTSATFQPRDLAGGADGPVKQCMEQKALGVTTPAGDEPDVEGYSISLSLRVP